MSDIAEKVDLTQPVLADLFIDDIATELTARKDAVSVEVILTAQSSAETIASASLIVSARYLIKDQTGKEMYSSDRFNIDGLRNQGDLTNPEQASRERFTLADLSRYVSRSIGDKYLSMGVTVRYSDSNRSIRPSSIGLTSSDKSPLTRE